MTSLDQRWIRLWLETAAVSFATGREALSGLDREIGDGDHGENLDRGFSALAAALSGVPVEASIADLFRLAGTTLIGTVGGAAGPLYGTAFLRASAASTDLTELDSDAIAAIIAAGLEGITQRGHARPGDKTMVDAWTPASDAASFAAAKEQDVVTVLDKAAVAAAAGAVATEPLTALKGRASYLGARSMGYRDPGAESSAMLFAAAATAAHAVVDAAV